MHSVCSTNKAVFVFIFFLAPPVTYLFYMLTLQLFFNFL